MYNVWVLTPSGKMKNVTEDRAVIIAEHHLNYIFFFAELV